MLGPKPHLQTQDPLNLSRQVLLDSEQSRTVVLLVTRVLVAKFSSPASQRLSWRHWERAQVQRGRQGLLEQLCKQTGDVRLASRVSTMASPERKHSQAASGGLMAERPHPRVLSQAVSPAPGARVQLPPCPQGLWSVTPCPTPSQHALEGQTLLGVWEWQEKVLFPWFSASPWAGLASIWGSDCLECKEFQSTFQAPCIWEGT